MEQAVLVYLAVFIGGALIGGLLTNVLVRYRSGGDSPAQIKADYEDYQNKVEDHFEETSRRFRQMTEQYQDLYQHLAEGATSLCRPDSEVAFISNQAKDKSVLESEASESNESDQHQGAKSN